MASARSRMATGAAVRTRLVCAHGLASIGMCAPWPALLSAVWEGSRDEALLGLTGAARMLPYVLCSWWVAGLADRWGRRRVVGWSLWGRVAFLALAGVALPHHLPTGIVCCTLAVAAGTPAYPALIAAMPLAAGGDGRRASTVLVTVEVASFVVGPAVGGLLLGRVSAGGIALLGAGLCALAAGVLVGITLPALHPGTETGVRAVQALVRASAKVRGAIAAICVVNFVSAALLVALVVLAEIRWGDEGIYGVMTAAFGFGSLAAPALWWLGRAPVRRVHAGMAVFAAALVVLVFASSPRVAAGVLAAAGALAVHVEAAATEVLQRVVPDEIRSGVLGTADALMVGSALLGSALGPPIAGLTGGEWLLVGLAVLTVGSGLLALPVVRRSVQVQASDQV